MERFLFDYIYEEQHRVVMNELISSGLDGAIEFIDKHFLELHSEGETEISAIRLRSSHNEEILYYKIHRDLVTRKP